LTLGAARLGGVEEFSTIRRIGDVMASLSPRRTVARNHAPASVGVFIQWGIGDAVLTAPLLAGLRAAWPEARIDAIGKPWLADLFDGERFVDRCVPLVPPWTKTKGKYRVWNREWRVFAREIAAARRIRYDLLVGIRWDCRELLLSRALRAAGMAGFAGAGGRKWVTIDLGLDAAGQGAMHRSEVAAHAARMLTGRAVSPIPTLSVRTRERHDLLERFRGAGHAGGPVVAIHTGAGSPIRRWPIERFNASAPPRKATNRNACNRRGAAYRSLR
jgi:ADP-heptose:LPS heptosyltransferase